MIDQLAPILDNSLVSGGLVLMAVGWLSYQARALPMKVFRVGDHLSARVLKVRESSELYDTALELVTESAIGGKGPRDLELKYIRTPTHEGDYKENGSHKLVATVTRFWARIDGCYCRVSISRGDEGDNRPEGAAVAPGMSMARQWTVTIRVYGGGRGAIERIARKIQERREAQRDRGVRVVVRTRYNGCETVHKPPRGPSTLCMPQHVIEDLLGRVDEFSASERLYTDRAQPWRMGILLHGKHGCGKTSLVHVLASRRKCDVFIMDINGFENDADLLRAFHSTTDNSIVLFEDIDCVFISRQKVGGEPGGVTFSGLLNAIDGIGSPSNGRIVVMTTNYLDRLDPALIRPGRVDHQIEVGKPSLKEAVAYAQRVYGVLDTDAVTKYVTNHEPTGAELELFVRGIARRERETCLDEIISLVKYEPGAVSA